ncbi:class F sortase [Bacillus wiedmannii]|uniref:Class F sortase n=1 Tax=Bacillus wiedmannii TaxID=1890302 RepID=A0A4U2N3L3_9BACI|nr:class F sortase [Bacillus wiedmannii]TKH18975.1 class F sortase [Bacillus wiedmannii]
MKLRLLLTLISTLILIVGYSLSKKGATLLPNKSISQPVSFKSFKMDNDKLIDRKGVQNISSPPVKLKFERTQVTVKISPVELDSTGRMKVHDGVADASWYKQSAIPGCQGNALIAGHRDWRGELGPFQYLEMIKKNEKVTIEYKNKDKLMFQVVERQIYSVNEIPDSVMNIGGETCVTLITCTGKFIRKKGGYQKRVIVTLQLI